MCSLFLNQLSIRCSKIKVHHEVNSLSQKRTPVTVEGDIL